MLLVTRCTTPFDPELLGDGGSDADTNADAEPDGTVASSDGSCGTDPCNCPAGLVCTASGACVCPDGSTYDPTTNTCGS